MILSRVDRDCSGNALYWSEPAITNTFLQSRTLATSWTKLVAADTIGGSIATPFGLTSTTAGLIGDATNVDHGVTQAATVTAAVWTMSVIAKAGSKTWAYLSDNTVVNATGYLNLSTCATGTAGAGVRELFATSLGNGWCRIGLSFTGTAAAHTFAIQSADADLDKTVTGDGATVMTYFTEMQLELWFFPTTRYPTTTATAARSADVLRYAGSGNATPTRGSLVCSIVVPASDYNTVGMYAGINDAAGATHNIEALVNTTDVTRFVENGGWDFVGTSDIADGLLATVSTTWTLGAQAIYVDGAQENTASVASVPGAADRLLIGVDLAGGSQFGGGIKRCRVFDTAGVRQ